MAGHRSGLEIAAETFRHRLHLKRPFRCCLRCLPKSAFGSVRAGYRRVALRPPAPFWFGQPREAAAPAPARVVVRPIDTEQPVQRVTLSGGEALRLARVLVRLVDDLTFVDDAASRSSTTRKLGPVALA